jgi:hypothetical protein
MPGSVEPWIGDRDLALPDVLADVLAASNDGYAALDVPNHLMERGHTSIKTVVGYLQRNRPPPRGSGPWAPADHHD